MPSGHFYVKKLYKNSKVDDAKLLKKLKNDKIALKRHLKVTRHNNSVLKTIVEELKTKNGQIEDQLQESKAEIEHGTNAMTSMKTTIEESELKVEKLEEEIGELKTNQTKLASELENYKSTDADLVLAQLETKKCTEELEAETRSNLQCESDKIACEKDLKNEVQEKQNLHDQNSELMKSVEKLTEKNEGSLIKVEKLEDEIGEFKSNQTKLIYDLESFKSTDADLVVSQQETKDCIEELEAEKKTNLQCQSDKEATEEKLESEVQKSQNLHDQNSELMKSVEKYTEKNEVSVMKVEQLEDHVEKLMTNQTKLVSDLENCKITDANLVISQQEIEKCNQDLEAATHNNRRCQLENDSNLKIILELKANQTKLITNLDSFKSTDADLVISQRELKECNEDLEAKTKRNFQCVSGQKICEKELENEIQKYKKLEASHSDTLKLFEESRSISSTNQKLAQVCQSNLEDLVEEKEVLQEKIRAGCPLGSEWSSCSKTCWGTKTRTVRFSNSKEQVESCNQDISCPRSGKYL